MSRHRDRRADGLRPVKFTRHFTRHAEGSVLVEFGHTQVLCTASIEDRVPPFLRDKKQGWVTAEYGMLPRATHMRTAREAARGKQSGRTQEIQRLIGRSLRAAVDLELLGERTITVDCDVIQADGGTRTASITGGFVALVDALRSFEAAMPQDPLRHHIASVSVGVLDDTTLLDLEYSEDSQASTDMNIVMNEQGDFIEIQGTAEGGAFSQDHLQEMIDYAARGIERLIELQRAALQGA